MPNCIDSKSTKGLVRDRGNSLLYMKRTFIIFICFLLRINAFLFYKIKSFFYECGYILSFCQVMLLFITLAGDPATTELAGTSLVTTDPVAITLSGPIVRPFNIRTWAAIQT